MAVTDVNGAMTSLIVMNARMEALKTSMVKIDVIVVDSDGLVMFGSAKMRFPTVNRNKTSMVALSAKERGNLVDNLRRHVILQNARV